MLDVNFFDELRIGLASGDDIRFRRIDAFIGPTLLPGRRQFTHDERAG